MQRTGVGSGLDQGGLKVQRFHRLPFRNPQLHSGNNRLIQFFHESSWFGGYDEIRWVRMSLLIFKGKPVHYI